MYAVVVDQNTIHLEIGLLAILLVGVFNEGVLQAITCTLVSNDLTAKDLAKSRKDELQIFVLRHWVELADEQHVLRGCYFGEWQIANHLKRKCLCARLAFSANLFQGFWVIVLVEVFIVCDADGGELRSRGHGALWWLGEARGVVVWIIEDDGV
jgi:hypothetical protein